MQDIHSIGGGGRLFGGGGDRRMRPHQHQSNQALKCPRCDSANTKFCYYNNYNLSQPRHFCKSCRRYWTKGGVLRNVPVGGGCRKAKRSKTKASSSSDARKEKKSSSNSSSENSSLTASNTAATTASTAATGTEVGSGSCSTSASTLLNFPSSVFFNIPQSSSLSFDPPSLIDLPSEGRIFSEIGSFTSMMALATDQSPQIGFDVADASASAYQEPDPEDPNRNDEWGKQQKMACTMAMVEEEMKLEGGGGGGFLNQTAEIDLSGRGSNGGLGALDWQGGTDQGIFDLSGAVDQAYWSQPQWTDNDQSLYLP